MSHTVPGHGSEVRFPADQELVAGRSARDVANGADSAAERLERKAAYARRRADSFRQGAAGEAETAAALADLTQHGWFVVHDRLLPAGGNIDHLVIGPGGVVVVDSKSWSGAVVCDGNDLKVASRNKSAQVAAVVSLAQAVHDALRHVDPGLPVYSAISLTQEPPPAGPTRLAAGPLVVGVADLAAAIRALPATVRAAQVDTLVAAALAAFPTCERTVEEALQTDNPDRKPAGELFLRSNIFLFLEPWSRAGHRRLYLNDVEGDALGFKDLVSGEISVSVQEQEDVVRGVLANAHAGGPSLSRSALPKIPVQLPGGRLLGHLGRMWSSFLVGHHWRRGGKDRIYVTHAVLDQGIFELGYVDLTTGLLHPTSEEPLAKDLREPRRYLERVAERYPRR